MFFKNKKISVDTDPEKIDDIFSRGTVVGVIPDENDLKKRMLNGDRLRIYWGFDATGTTLHLSHAKNFILLEKFRKLGHEVIVLFGDFTARIGDPTDKGSTRKQLSRNDVLNNVSKWRELIKPLMGFDDPVNPVLIKYNHDWLSKLSSEEWVDLASNFTVQQMLERDMFDKRLKENKPIYVHEFFYPLMQGYDSVAMDVDVEMCGTDQTFNALAGRTLLKKLSGKEKSVVTVTLMENPNTGELMSKSNGTGVFLGTGANDMFGQIMSQDDVMIKVLFTHITNLNFEEIQLELEKGPRDAKLSLAVYIVEIFYGRDDAERAKENWITQFSNKGIPNNLQEFDFQKGIKILEVLKETQISPSNKESRRKVDEGAVYIDEEKVSDHYLELKEGKNVLKLGKKMAIINIK